MRESTEVVCISAGSDHGETEGKSPVHTPLKKRKDVVPMSPSQLSEEIQDEIDDLYDDVPEVKRIFKIVDKIGEGTFSSVFLARLRECPEAELFALKHIIPTSHPSRIEQELSCLQEIGGLDNVMGVRLCLRKKDHVVIVMPYFPHDKFQDYVQSLSVPEVHGYMRNLLLALSRVHQFDVIHRDIKPSNFLCNRQTKQFALVDFGLAHKAPVPPKDIYSKSTPISPSKRRPLEQSLENKKSSSGKTTFTPPTSVKGKGTTSKPNYQTPPTPEMGNLAEQRKKKSPRRFLLARRMLMANQQQESSKRSNPSSGRSSRLRGDTVPITCQCYGRPIVCSMCLSRSNQVAPRAGTPGFRSPEVLMKCPDQSTAVDIWSAGVIFLSLLSGRYPFFRANDDLTALAQIISIMGSEEVKKAGKTYCKMLTCNPAIPKLDLKTMCEKLRRVSKECWSARRRSDTSDKENQSVYWENVPNSAYDLLHRLLDLNPDTRITASEALSHPFFSGESKS